MRLGAALALAAALAAGCAERRDAPRPGSLEEKRAALGRVSAAAAAPPVPDAAVLSAAVEQLELATVHATSALASPPDVALADASADLVLDHAPAASPDLAARAGRALAAWMSALVSTAPIGSGGLRAARVETLAARVRASPPLAAAAAPFLSARDGARATLAARIESLAGAALRDSDYRRLSRLDGLLQALASGAVGAPRGGSPGARMLTDQLAALREAIYGPAAGPLSLGVERFGLAAGGATLEAIVWLRRDEAPGLPPLLVDPRAIRLVAGGATLDPIPPPAPRPGDLIGGVLGPRGEVGGRIVFPVPPGGAGTSRALVYSPGGAHAPLERTLPPPVAPPAPAPATAVERR